MNPKYTVFLKDIMENEGSKVALEKALSTYPMYTPKNPANYSVIPTREELNKKLLNHYKYREIGFETVGRFIEELEIAMCEIMPYYYQMMKSEDIMNSIEDPFGNVDIVESFEQSRNDTASGSTTATDSNNESMNGSKNTSGSTTNNGKHVEVDTPQHNLGYTSINDVRYASKIDYDTQDQTENVNTKENTSINRSGTSSSESESSSNGTTTHTLSRKGNQGVNTYAHDMGELRTIFMNIVQDIINDPRITELFMNVY